MTDPSIITQDREKAGDSAEGHAKPASNEHRLGMLMDYTKLHIGLYAVVITTLMALRKIDAQIVPEYYRLPIIISLVLVLFAGLCGGIIASNLPEQKDFDQFWDNGVGIWGKNDLFKTRYVARFEHIFFWLGVLNAVFAVLCGETYFLAIKS
ncbi:hypothetical protein [Sedimentitalea todarodis]|uniref:Uncharacterized protein n=1 Tax=Sedimentitalea todarodis TaxID=1631240 RepID=A0ABU3V9X8_9RHOB|nr:hypothetical protein [Sedimentitalea todarodis]MDU9002981.1 hypothetical protein [Sedimentitalea todarodis]